MTSAPARRRSADAPRASAVRTWNPGPPRATTTTPAVGHADRADLAGGGAADDRDVAGHRHERRRERLEVEVVGGEGQQDGGVRADEGRPGGFGAGAACIGVARRPDAHPTGPLRCIHVRTIGSAGTDLEGLSTF